MMITVVVIMMISHSTNFTGLQCTSCPNLIISGFCLLLFKTVHKAIVFFSINKLLTALGVRTNVTPRTQDHRDMFCWGQS